MPKRAGRPEIPPSQRRESVLRFVVTRAEFKKIKDKARSLGQSVSEYLRGVAIPKD